MSFQKGHPVQKSKQSGRNFTKWILSPYGYFVLDKRLGCLVARQVSRGCLVLSSHKEDSLDCLVALSYQDRKCAIFDRRVCGICLILLREVCRSSPDIMWDCYRVISKMQHNYITVSSMSRNVRKCTFRHVHPAKIQIRLHSLIRVLTGFILDSQAFFFSCGQEDFSLRKHAYSNILKISPTKTESFQIKKKRYFSYFCSKHRLWVLVRTASPRRF